MDVACHGVSNSKLTESYLRGCEKLYGKKISGYSFRNKGKKFGTERSSMAEFKFADGSAKKLDRDILFWGFVKGLFIRESCDSCPENIRQTAGASRQGAVVRDRPRANARSRKRRPEKIPRKAAKITDAYTEPHTRLPIV